MYSDDSSLTSTTTTNSTSNLSKKYHYYSMRYQTILDRLNGRPLARWSIFLCFFLLYLFRVFFWGGWYIVTYALGIYYLNLLIAFLSPQVDPELENDFDSYDDASSLPNIVGTASSRKFSKRSGGMRSGEEEFRPFIRRLPEFKFWYSCTKAILIALFFTSSRAFDIPVYYPILLGYFILLFILTMRKQIQHMIKYKYVPFTVGKKAYKPSAYGPSVTSTLAATGSATSGSSGGMMGSGVAPSPQQQPTIIPPMATGGLLNTYAAALQQPPTTSLSYTPATGMSTGYQLPKPGIVGLQQQQNNIPTPAYQGFQTTVSPLSTTATATAAAATVSKTGKKD